MVVCDCRIEEYCNEGLASEPFGGELIKSDIYDVCIYKREREKMRRKEEEEQGRYTRQYAKNSKRGKQERAEAVFIPLWESVKLGFGFTVGRSRQSP